MTPDVDTRSLKDRVRATREPGDPARVLVEALPDRMDPYSFSVSSEALIRALVARKD